MSDQDQNDPVAAFNQMLGGWNVLDGNLADQIRDNMTPEQRAAAEAAAQDRYELNQAIHRCFNTPDGQIVLDWMRIVATEGQRFDISAQSTNVLLAAAMGFFREGQAVFYFDIINRMKAAEEGPPAAQN